MSFKVLGISSSQGEFSFSAAGLNIVLEKIKQSGVDTELLDLKQTILPLFSTTSNKNDAIDVATKMVKSADAFILATPDYHGSMSGSMKNFLDYYWSEFSGKLFGYVCASHEKGLTAMDQMRTAIRQCSGWSMPYGISINGDDDFDENGSIINDQLNSKLTMLARDLTVYGKLIQEQFIADLNATNSDTFASNYRS
jgi:azobenzene reductase